MPLQQIIFRFLLMEKKAKYKRGKYYY